MHAVLPRGQGRPDPRGGHHRGRRDGVASRPPAPSYATWATPMIPFYIFYSMFGFQRTGDLIWAFGDLRGPRLPARRHGRTHDAQRRGPPARGRPSPRAGVDGPEPARLRPGVRLRDGGHRRGRHPAHVRRRSTTPRRLFYYLTLYNENYAMPAMPQGDAVPGAPELGTVPEGIARGLYRFAPRRTEAVADGRRSCSPARHPRRRSRRSASSPTSGTAARSCGRPRRTRRCARRRSSVERWNRLHPSRPAGVPYVDAGAGDSRRARSSP